MMINKVDAIEDGIILSGIGVSLVDIQTVMSIILLTFNILWLVMKFTLKLFRYLKDDGKLSDDEIDDLLNEADKIESKLKDGDKNEENNTI